MYQDSVEKLGEMAEGRLLITMSVPMMLSMLVQALYNLVDSMFVAHICEDALTAVSLAYPVQMAMSAIAVGTGVGVNAMVSRSLGRGQLASATRYANAQIFLSACYTLFFILVGLFLPRLFYTQQTDVEAIVNYGIQYLSIVCIGCVGLFFSQNLEKLLVSTGLSGASMLTQICGALTNLILDPLLIFGLGPFPSLGVAGAAIATIIGQGVSALFGLWIHHRRQTELSFQWRQMRPGEETVKNIFAIGFPSMITMGLTSVMAFLLNQIFLTFSTTAAAVYGIWIKLQSLGMMPVFGLNNGTVAIYSYNFGAGHVQRIRRILRLALLMGIGVTTVVAVVYFCIPGLLLSLFDASPYLLAIGIPALRLCCCSLPFAACVVILSSFFQSLNHSGYALLVNVCRQFAIQVPLAWLLSLSGILQWVWFAPLMAEAASMLVALWLCRQVMKGLLGGTNG